MPARTRPQPAARSVARVIAAPMAMDDDPYRSMQQVGMCPRCGNSTESDGEQRLVCVRGCGEWYPRERFIAAAWGLVTAGGSQVQPQPWPFEPAKCPTCS